MAYINSKVRPVQRIQLVFPPMLFAPNQSRQTATFPLGLGYIAAVLEQDGYDVNLVDCPSEGYKTITQISRERAVYGLTEQQTRKRIESFRPDMIGISCLFSSLENQMKIIARFAKQVDPDIVVVCGGPHVSAVYQRVIKEPAIDYCVVGEGERIISHLVQALNGCHDLASVTSLCYRHGGKIVWHHRESWIDNLDALPYPARHLADFERYFEIGKVQGLRLDDPDRLRLAQMTTSRGFPFQCTYCAKNITWGKKYRTRSVKSVLDEMEHLIETFGIQRFAFQDDNFTADMKRAAEIFDGIVERRFDITWEAHNGLGVNYLSSVLLDKMKASGCVSFTIAVESANDATLTAVRKPNYIDSAPPIVEKAKALGIEVRGFFMIGFPDETLDEVWRTVEYARRLNLAVSAFALVTPLPGTVLWQQCVDAGIIDDSTIDFEELSFGAFDLPLSLVPVNQLKAIRKIEWLKTVLMDEKGGFRCDIKMKPEDVMGELSNGLNLFPDNKELQCLQEQALIHYGNGEKC